MIAVLRLLKSDRLEVAWVTVRAEEVVILVSLRVAKQVCHLEKRCTNKAIVTRIRRLDNLQEASSSHSNKYRCHQITLKCFRTLTVT